MYRFTLLASFFLLFVTRAYAAENVYLTLKSNGTQIQGESSTKTLGRENSIECFSYEQDVEVNNGKKQYDPIVITKRLDKSSPLLMKAMTEGATLDATFRFFRPNPSGDGTIEGFYTVTLGGAHIVSLHQSVPDTRDKTASALAPIEEVAFNFSKISWTYTNGGVTHQDDAVQMAGAPATGATRPFRFPLPRE